MYKYGVLMFAAMFISSVLSANNTLLSLQGNCFCPGETVILECSITGGGNTVWEGSALTCPSDNNRIILRHSQFAAGISGQCGTLTARATRNENNQCFVSQITFTATSILNRTMLTCSHVAVGGVTNSIGQWTIHIIEDPLPRISEIGLDIHDRNNLNFTWNHVIQPSCLALFYRVNSSNCGMCPGTTNVNSVLCENVTVSHTIKLCKISFQAVCGDIDSEVSDEVQVTLKLPNVLILKIERIYSNTTKQLARLTTFFNETVPFMVYGNIDGSATSYTITYSDSTTGNICGTDTILASSCVNSACSHVLVSSCPPSTDISSIIFATNILGDGPVTHQTTDGTNKFVTVIFNVSTQRMVCNFLNQQPTQGAVLRTCTANITFGSDCQIQLGIFHGEGSGIFVNTESLELLSQIKEYCFTVNASNNTHTLTVQGNFTYTSGSKSSVNIPAAVIVPLFITILVISSALIVITTLYLRHHQSTHYNSEPDHDHVTVEPKQVKTFTIKVYITNQTGTLLRTLNIFKELNINILKINTLRVFDPTPGYMNNSVECDCPAEMTSNLRKLLQAKGAINIDFLEEKEAKVKITFSVKDQPGCFYEAMKAFEELHIGRIYNINNKMTVSDPQGYENQWIQFECTQQECEELRRHLNASDFVKCMHIQSDDDTQATTSVQFSVKHKVGSLLRALQVFNDLGINIKEVNPGHLMLTHYTLPEPGFKDEYITCSCDNDTKKVLFEKLETYGAVKIGEQKTENVARPKDAGPDYCVIKFSVKDEVGALGRSLQAFVDLGINIDGVNVLHLGIHRDDITEFRQNEVTFTSTRELLQELYTKLEDEGKAFNVIGPQRESSTETTF